MHIMFSKVFLFLRVQDANGDLLFQIDKDGRITTRTNTLDREYMEYHTLLVEARDEADHVATGLSSWL